MTSTDNVSTESLRHLTRDEVDDMLGPVAGDPVIGTLDTELVGAFIELTGVENVLEAFKETYTTRYRAKFVERVMDLDMRDGAQLTALFERGIVETESEAIELLRTIAEYEELRATFWMRVRVTFNVWNAFVDIRKGFRLVNLGPKFKV